MRTRLADDEGYVAGVPLSCVIGPALRRVGLITAG
jgi:hypothetical protein